jgi:hypothetical protein
VSVPGLLVDVQRRLESLYALEPEAPVTDFLLSAQDAQAYPGGGSRTLIAQDGDCVSLGVVLDPGVGARLAELDPRVQLDGRNLDSFCTAAEEVSHFVYLLFCARTARTVTELELELQAEVDKFVSCLLCDARTVDAPGELRARLYGRVQFAHDLDHDERARYHTANGEARRYAEGLERRFLRPQRMGDMLDELRRFYRLSLEAKLGHIASRAA